MPCDEEQRQAALDRYHILDTPPERTFDGIAVLGSHANAVTVKEVIAERPHPVF